MKYNIDVEGAVYSVEADSIEEAEELAEQQFMLDEAGIVDVMDMY